MASSIDTTLRVRSPLDDLLEVDMIQQNHMQTTSPVPGLRAEHFIIPPVDIMQGPQSTMVSTDDMNYIESGHLAELRAHTSNPSPHSYLSSPVPSMTSSTVSQDCYQDYMTSSSSWSDGTQVPDMGMSSASYMCPVSYSGDDIVVTPNADILASALQMSASGVPVLKSPVPFSAPAPTRGRKRTLTSDSDQDIDKSKPKRRRVINKDQRTAANHRERKRMVTLNDAFDELKQRIPTFSHEKKLSRIETLRLAISYINFMSQMIDTSDSQNMNPAHNHNFSANFSQEDMLKHMSYMMDNGSSDMSLFNMGMSRDMEQNFYHNAYIGQ